jgi:hypothetical protein
MEGSVLLFLFVFPFQLLPHEFQLLRLPIGTKRHFLEPGFIPPYFLLLVFEFPIFELYNFLEPPLIEPFSLLFRLNDVSNLFYLLLHLRDLRVHRRIALRIIWKDTRSNWSCNLWLPAQSKHQSVVNGNSRGGFALIDHGKGSVDLLNHWMGKWGLFGHAALDWLDVKSYLLIWIS